MCYDVRSNPDQEGRYVESKPSTMVATIVLNRGTGEDRPAGRLRSEPALKPSDRLVAAVALTLPHSDQIEDVLGRVYEIGNGPDFFTKPEDLPLAKEYRASGPGRRAVSIGDVIVLEIGSLEMAYVVDRVGFESIGIGEPVRALMEAALEGAADEMANPALAVM